MHLVVVHGYLLGGTGSNVYVGNIARTWAAQGHAVTVLCQDRGAGDLSFVDEVVQPGQTLSTSPPGAGKVRVVVPDIAGLLPVYVVDRYEGLTVKAIPDLTPEEIERHVDLTAKVLAKVARGADFVLANHALLSPLIARRALADTSVRYDVKIHGSALEYVLEPHPRLMPYAVEGLAGARTVFVGSTHMRERVLRCFGKKTPVRVVSPGMDPDLFRPVEDIAESEKRFLDAVSDEVDRRRGGRRAHVVPEPSESTSRELHERLVRDGAAYDHRAPDADLVDRWPGLRAGRPVVCFFGKFLEAKGVGELVAAAPAVLARVPEARFLLVGFGAYREHLEGMIQSLEDGDRNAFHRFARAGEFVARGDATRWFRQISGNERSRITVTGYLDHERLQHVLPLASVAVVPSKRPEAFGMVAVEAMAAGVLPLCCDHSGLSDVIEAVREEAPEIAGLMVLDRERLLQDLPERIVTALDFLYPDGFENATRRTETGATLRRIAVERFSWDRVARALLAP